jgi:hypothetical protein
MDAVKITPEVAADWRSWVAVAKAARETPAMQLHVSVQTISVVNAILSQQDKMLHNMQAICQVATKRHNEIAAQFQALADAVRRMHDVEDTYGCGFSEAAAWNDANNEARRLAGMKGRT